MHRAILAITVLLLAIAMTFVGLALWPTDEPAWARIQRTQIIRIGYSPEAPYAYRDSTGQVTGEAPTLAKQVLADMGLPRIEWVELPFGNLIPGLQTGRFDLIAAGMYVTPERAQRIAFSTPTYCTGRALLVRSGNPRNLQDLADLAAQPDARLAVLTGAVEQQQARESGIPDRRIIAFPDASAAVKGLQAGLADALALNRPAIQYLVNAHPGLERAAPPPEQNAALINGCGAFGFRRQDQELREAFDARLQSLLGTSTHLQLVRPFGFTRQDLPPGVNPRLTTEQEGQ